MKEKKKNVFRNVLPYFKNKKILGLFLFSLICLIAGSAISLISPRIFSGMIDQLGDPDFFNSRLYTLLALISLFNIIFPYLQSYFNSIIGEKIGQDLRNRLIKKLLNQDYMFIQKNKSSKILTIIMSDTNFVKNILFSSITTIITSIIMIIGSSFGMFSIYPKLALPIIISLPILAVILILFARNKMYLFKKSQKARDRLNRIINENIKGAMLIRVFVAEKTEKSKFRKANSNSKDVGIQISQIIATLIPMVNAINVIASVLIVNMGGKSVMNGALTVGELSAFNSYVGLFGGPLIILGFLSTSFGQAVASLGRINRVLDSEEKFEDGELKISTIEEIKIRNLSRNFGTKAVLENINMDIIKGQKVGIVGLIGSGKSILLHHLIRVYDPSEGHIKINNKDIKEYSIRSVREKIGFCFQDNFLVDGSIEYNITFGRKINEKDLQKAINTADVPEILRSKKLGILSNVGERGSNLSGGQKQRIMLARALAVNPQILIMDNATSRLDINTEKKIFTKIKQNYPEITIIIVSQKIYSIRDCDKIYVMDKGKIVSEGTHNSLIKTSPIYKEIELTQRNYKS